MSEAYARETSLVSAESNYYDRALDTAIALTILGFTLGLLTLVKAIALETAGGALTDFFVSFLAVTVGAIGVVGLFSALNVVPITSQRVRGIGLGLLVGLVGLTALAALLDVTLATLLGLVLLVEAVIVCAAGVVSAQGIVDTEPSPSAGLLAGVAFGVVGMLIGAALGGTVFGGSPVAYYGSAIVGALGLTSITIVPREDLGSALPVTILVGTLGLVIATGTIGLGWTWSPDPNVDGDFTGQVVVPLFVLLGSIVASWGAAKARAGYGARGRQFGAYLVVYLNAAMMVGIMVSIVAFVASKGLTYAFHGFQIGAVAALVVLSPAIVLVANWARRPAGSADWHSGARQFFRIVPLAALGAAAGLASLVVLTGESFEIPFSYTVWVNRQPEILDTAASLTAQATVGNLVVIFAGGFLMWYFFRKYGSLRGVGTQFDRLAAVERWTGIAMGAIVALALVLVVLGKQPFGLPLAGTLGVALVHLSSLAAAGFALVASGTLLVGGGGVNDRATDRAQFLLVGIFGAMGLLVVTTILEPVAAATPSVGPVALVPGVAVLALLASAGVAVLTAVAARSATGDDARVLRRETALGLFGVAGFAVVVVGFTLLKRHAIAEEVPRILARVGGLF